MTDRSRAPLEQLIAQWRERADEYRAYRSNVPCQCEPSWHAEEIDRWAEALALVLGPQPVEEPVYGKEVLCESCAKVFCPHGERLHFHHDGCPACSEEERPEAPNEADALVYDLPQVDSGRGVVAVLSPPRVEEKDEPSDEGTICPVCKCPALQSWNRVNSDECGVLCIACSAEFAPVLGPQREEPGARRLLREVLKQIENWEDAEER